MVRAIAGLGGPKTFVVWLFPTRRPRQGRDDVRRTGFLSRFRHELLVGLLRESTAAQGQHQVMTAPSHTSSSDRAALGVSLSVQILARCNAMCHWARRHSLAAHDSALHLLIYAKTRSAQGRDDFWLASTLCER